MMNFNISRRWMVLPLLSMLAIISCSSLATLQPPQPTPIQSTQIETNSTETVQPTLIQSTPTAEVVQGTLAATSSPSCTVLQDLNLRFGPGTAYIPRIRVLPADSILTPLGFAPKGIPGGSWAYVQDTTSQDKGWVSAGTQYISCNVDVTALALVAFGTPVPPPLPNTAQASPGPGTCGQGGVTSDNGVDVYDCTVVFSNDGLIQFKVLKNGQEIGKPDGVQNVNFSVTQGGDKIYDHTESNAPYCIFGGDGPCNSWVLEDYLYKWEPGGSIIEAKKYSVSITATLDDPSVNLFWSADIRITLP
jgi:hypothetical protein